MVLYNIYIYTYLHNFISIHVSYLISGLATSSSSTPYFKETKNISHGFCFEMKKKRFGFSKGSVDFNAFGRLGCYVTSSMCSCGKRDSQRFHTCSSEFPMGFLICVSVSFGLKACKPCGQVPTQPFRASCELQSESFCQSDRPKCQCTDRDRQKGKQRLL